MKSKTYVCLHCFTQIDVKYPDSMEGKGCIEDCPMCGDELREVPNNLNINSVKYHLEQLMRYLSPEVSQ